MRTGVLLCGRGPCAVCTDFRLNPEHAQKEQKERMPKPATFKLDGPQSHPLLSIILLVTNLIS